MARDSTYAILPDELLRAYRLGYFPMAEARDDPQAMWVLPELRGVLQLENARAPKKLKRLIRTEPFTIRTNCAFLDVINACAEDAPDRRETWINDQIIEVYTELHYQGQAHSVEVYDQDRLVGGLYGVAIGAVFCGESMFSRADNASKIAMVYLIARLKHCGVRLLDTQFFSDHLAQFGVEEISNNAYQRLLSAYCDGPAASFASVSDAELSTSAVLQSITQIS